MAAPCSTNAGRPARFSPGLSDLHEDRRPQTAFIKGREGGGEFYNWKYDGFRFLVPNVAQ